MVPPRKPLLMKIVEGHLVCAESADPDDDRMSTSGRAPDLAGVERVEASGSASTTPV